MFVQILPGKFSGVVAAAAKSKGWDELAKEITAVSGILNTAQEVQKEWVCMKSGAKAAAGSDSSQLVNRRSQAAARGSADRVL